MGLRIGCTCRQFLSSYAVSRERSVDESNHHLGHEEQILLDSIASQMVLGRLTLRPPKLQTLGSSRCSVRLPLGTRGGGNVHFTGAG